MIGKYTTRSTYDMQFQGSFADFDWSNVWATKVENKCCFFSWLWTLDQVIAHGGQGDRVCKLCYMHQESALHMLARCPYSRVVW
jgi:hypothetical protein